MSKLNTPGLAAQCLILTSGWILSGCNPETVSHGSSANGSAGTTSAAPVSGAGVAAVLGNAVAGSANTGGLGGAVPIPRPPLVIGQAGVAAAGTAPPPPPLGSSGMAGVASMVAGASAPAAGSSSPPAQGSGCGLDPIPSGSGTIQVGGMARTYQFSVPQGYNKSRNYPVVFGFHGAGVPASAFRTYFNMTQVVGPDAIVVYPEALGSPMAWNAQRDIPLFDALLTQFKAQYCIDDKRVFAAGHSSGGFFTHALGCQRGNVLRAIGPMSAGPPFGTCVGQIAVWISQGNADPTVKPASGQMARDFWAKRNHCDTTMSKPVDPAPTVEYSGCDAGFAVRYCEYDGEHNLPSYAPKGIWDFFKSL